MEFYRRAIAIEPNDADIRAVLGALLRPRKEVEEACEHYRHAVRLRPDEPEGLFGLGATLLGLFLQTLAHCVQERSGKHQRCTGMSLPGPGCEIGMQSHRRTAIGKRTAVAGVEKAFGGHQADFEVAEQLLSILDTMASPMRLPCAQRGSGQSRPPVQQVARECDRASWRVNSPATLV